MFTEPAPQIRYFEANGTIAYMDDVPVEMREVPSLEFPSGVEHGERPIYGEYARLDKSTADEAKALLVNRLLLRAKFEKAGAAEYAFTERKDHEGVDCMFVVALLT